MVYVRVFADGRLRHEFQLHKEHTNVEALSRHVMDVDPNLTKLVISCDGRIIRDGEFASLPSFTDKSSILVLQHKVMADQKDPSQLTISEDEATKLSQKINRALQNRMNRSRLLWRHLMTDRETMEKMMMQIPALNEDLVALGVLRDPVLAVRWMKQDHLKTVLQEHPAFFIGVRFLWSKVKDMTKPRLSREDPENNFVMADQFNPLYGSDEEEEDTEDENMEPGNGQNPRQVITPGLLQEALAATAGFGRPSASGSSSRPGPSSVITPEMLQQAMQVAIGGATPAASGGSSRPQTSNDSTRTAVPQPSTGITPEMLQLAMETALGGGGSGPTGQQAQASNHDHLLPQLHVMGFNDDAENRSALAATNGDVEAALVWIIDRREQMEGDLD